MLLGKLKNHLLCESYTEQIQHSSEILRKAADSDTKDLPTGTHYYTDGSKSELRVAAAYIVNIQTAYFRLNNDATITQTEFFGIWGCNRACCN